MSKGSDNPFPSILVVEGSTPASPASGDQRIFIDSADHVPKRVNSSGTVSPVAGLVQISKQILGSPASTITFSSIPGTYSGLRLVLVGRLDEAVTDDFVYVQFNTDTGANYDEQRMNAGGTSVTGNLATAQTKARIGDITAASGTANMAGMLTMDIPVYAGTTFYKQWITDGWYIQAAGFCDRFAFAGQWRSTVAITSMLLLLSTGNFITGTTAILYGLV